jgi:homoserine O-acetyltransferase
MIGPGKAFDTNRYFVVCSNVLGSCYGTTGPSSIDPKTGRPYALRFPVVTIRDMVQVQARLLDYLGIRRVLCVTGGSMGGMQALQWAVIYPERVRSVIAIATTHRHSAQQIAFNEVARQAIMADPAWNGGDYYGTPGPRLGLAVARMIGHITYLSDVSMERKFGRRLRNRERYGYDFSLDFEVESYLRYQGQSFVERFDANSLLYLTKALDYFDLSQNHGSLTHAFAGSPSLYLFITFSSDWLYPPHQLKEVAQAIRRGGGDASYCEINSDYGHDAFLLEHATQEPLIRSFLDRVQNTTVAGDTGEGI